jgi:redox-sensitive bicupin YhaK (pirin superfamily)
MTANIGVYRPYCRGDIVSRNEEQLAGSPGQEIAMKRVTGPTPSPALGGRRIPARSMFSYNTHGQHLSPFLLLDYAGPYTFAPSDTPRGVGQHPHRGFETVTIVYEGEVAHRDSTGAGGTIGPGDVQWMTAASGILHEEFHTPEFSKRGGTLDMVQLWVNLPARDKMGAPGYQTLLDADIPSVDLPDGAGRVRVIAGRFDGHAGPARTHTPMDVWDIRLQQGHHAELPVADGRTLALVVLKGTVRSTAARSARRSWSPSTAAARTCSSTPTATPPCCCSAASRSTSRWWAMARSS